MQPLGALGIVQEISLRISLRYTVFFKRYIAYCVKPKGGAFTVADAKRNKVLNFSIQLIKKALPIVHIKVSFRLPAISHI